LIYGQSQEPKRQDHRRGETAVIEHPSELIHDAPGEDERGKDHQGGYEKYFSSLLFH